MFNGRFFHRLEVPIKPVHDSVKRMRLAIEEYYANGNNVRANGLRKSDKQDVWQRHRVPKTSFYDAIKWEADNPGLKWDANRIRNRGKTSLLTLDMEQELLHWIALSQKLSGGVDLHAVCRVGFALMASDPEHHALVKRDHPEYRDEKKREISSRWFHRLKQRYPDYLSKHATQGYAVGRAQITRPMIDTIYSVLQTVLDEAANPISASNIWNFDETGHNMKYVRTFLYGLRGATKNNSEQCGLGEHVTVGADANVLGQFLDPLLLFTGSDSSKANLTTLCKNAGFGNALVLMKKNKASMDDKIFSIVLDWFGNELKEKGFKGQHILFVDNHDSHERSQPISVAMKHGIILITFPSHCTHLVQMLDLSFFKPLKAAWKTVSQKWCDEECTDDKPYISKQVFCTLFFRAWSLAAIIQNAING